MPTAVKQQFLIAALDAALNALNTPENAISPSEKRLIEQFKAIEAAYTSVADYVWLPIEFENEKPVLKWQDAWTPAGLLS